MNENETKPADAAKAAKPKPTPKAKAPPKKTRSPRKVDAAIVAIHKEAAAKVAEYRKEKSGERILCVIMEKRLAQLTDTQKQTLFEELSKTCTPTLNLVDLTPKGGKA